MIVGMISNIVYIPDVNKHTVKYHQDCMNVQKKYVESGFSLRKTFPAAVAENHENLTDKLRKILRKNLEEYKVDPRDFRFDIKFTDIFKSDGFFSLIEFESKTEDISIIQDNSKTENITDDKHRNTPKQ